MNKLVKIPVVFSETGKVLSVFITPKQKQELEKSQEYGLKLYEEAVRIHTWTKADKIDLSQAKLDIAAEISVENENQDILIDNTPAEQNAGVHMELVEELIKPVMLDMLDIAAEISVENENQNILIDNTPAEQNAGVEMVLINGELVQLYMLDMLDIAAEISVENENQ